MGATTPISVVRPNIDHQLRFALVTQQEIKNLLRRVNRPRNSLEPHTYQRKNAIDDIATHCFK
jgi:hypothetical protein